MSTASLSRAERSTRADAEPTEKKANPKQNSPAQPKQDTHASPAAGGGSDEEWETIDYDETEEGSKARHMLFGHFQIKRKKKRIFSYHWNVRKY